ncbi:MAG: hypothetical protein C4520_02275 [Candidatus Abyssobacteria bacterium SURF_5]|uniref:Uncharacterized protein n=1 Tax=Abyssobacteria bacterium (strain SURF_5) TaxID=2093360 RepID=A0A3A4PC65_ABYX5|nr:MAG: hypothetical protein C4520_02275 [Candidatus Abyssubacteria bacterium SURF_5]
MARAFIGLLIIGTAAFSLYLTPAPVSKKSPLHFLQFFVLIAVAVTGSFMTLPFLFQWRLPLQQGLGSNEMLLLRGLFMITAALLAIIMNKSKAMRDMLWISAIALLAAGIPEIFRVLIILNDTVNGILQYGNVPMKMVYRTIYPFLILFSVSAAMILLGAVSLLREIYRFFIQ